VRALIAVGLTALSLILVVLCFRGTLPGLGAVAPMTLAFIAACVGVLGATDEDTTRARRRVAIAALVFAILVLAAACVALFHALADVR
jgi:hypothetical protein